MATLREMIDFAKKNPNSDFANVLRKRIDAGELDQRAITEGIALPGRYATVKRESIANVQNMGAIKGVQAAGETNRQVGQAFDKAEDFLEKRRMLENITPMGALTNYGSDIVKGAVKEGATGLVNVAETGLDLGIADVPLGIAKKGAEMVTGQDIPMEGIKSEIKRGFGQAREGIEGSDLLKAQNMPQWTADLLGSLITLGIPATHIQKAAKLSKLPWLANMLGQGVFGAATSQPEDRITGGVLAGGITGATDLAGKAVSSLIKNGPKKIISSTLKITKQQRKGLENPRVLGTSPEKWLLKNNIKGDNPDDIAKSLWTMVADNRKAKLDLLKKSNEVFKNKYVDSILKKLVDDTSDVVGLEKVNKYFRDLLGKSQHKGITLSEADVIKSNADDYYSFFGNSKKESIEKIGMQNIRQGLQNFIEDRANKLKLNFAGEGIKKINKKIQSAYAIASTIDDRMNVQASNNILGLPDQALIAGIIASRDPTAILSLVTKKIADNPNVRLKTAKGLNTFRDFLNKTKIDQVASKGVAAVSQSIKNLFTTKRSPNTENNKK